ADRAVRPVHPDRHRALPGGLPRRVHLLLQPVLLLRVPPPAARPDRQPAAGDLFQVLRAVMKLGKSTREAFGLALAELGDAYPDLVVLDGDVHNSTRTDFFAKKYPQRFFNVGIAESNLVSTAAGMACAGKRAWLASFACFVMCNAYDQ